MDKAPDNMIAVILSGGQSRRMGQDKGLIQENGLAWTESLQQKLEKVGLKTYVSINNLQKDAYVNVFSDLTLILDHPSSAHLNGPVKGILSAHLTFPEKDILFLPCDMPALAGDTFLWWANEFAKLNQEDKVVVCSTPDYLQPLCGVYSQASLKILMQYYEDEKLQDQSMHNIVEEMLKATVISIPSELLPQFKNFNIPDDLQS
ncbi:molybdenum cofactor guanylyltransferase [Catalinimonas alkaloidigena]|uniref:molybdenum cofactor guanylyltransferase n=1 Tax=Catalinimonas alkaloidigena TaxID=1075417 RepID=UPI0024053575|nr:molybdenum cofactor guanylyltransferase [Catalinimonas alkaloidigena]